MKTLLNDGWSFVKLPAGSNYATAAHSAFHPVDLPHDWLIWQSNLYETSDGWYRRILNVPRDHAVRMLCFDGVYMDCDILLNGTVIRTHANGYTCFYVDLTPHLQPGENEVMVHIRFRSPCSRWYSGAGIYRDVQLLTLSPDHLVPDGIYVHSIPVGSQWHMHITTEVVGEGTVIQRLMDNKGRIVAQGSGADCTLLIENPHVWSCDDPYLYTLETSFGEDRFSQCVGLRTLRMDPDQGLFLNGKHIKVHGVCLHHDLGALGAAFHEKAARRQLRLMQEMGANAIRTAHNPSARRLMELCDEMGLLVMNELYDMWHRPKTPFDHARFFDACMEEDIASWVRRDRNRPSLMLWSVGNEIQETLLDEDAPQITRRLMENVYHHDPSKNGLVTLGLNYMPWEGAQKCVDVLKIGGYNYAEQLYASHHSQYPDWVIFGSETASLVSSRGIYHFPSDAPILSDEDRQCSSLGNSTTSWGTKDICKLIVDDLQTPYSLGQFLWSGIDYIGEPTPYHTRGSYFGYADTACFPKDLFYLFKSLWTKEPMIHIGVHWDWNPGQIVDVNVMTNGAQAELFLNGQSLGRKQVLPHDPTQCMLRWRLPFARGELIARAYAADGTLLCEDVRRSFSDSRRIVLEAEDETLLADGHDMTFVSISAVDERGIFVANANDRIQLTVEGSGVLMGLDNGDAAEADLFKGSSMRLFSGKLLAMVGASNTPGPIIIRASAPGLEDAVLTLKAEPCRQQAGWVRQCACAVSPVGDAIEIRRIELQPEGSTLLTPTHPCVSFRWRCLPSNALPQPLEWAVTTATAIDSVCAELTVEEDRVTVRGLGDGTAYLRALCRSGEPRARVISHMEVSMKGFGQPHLDPYGFIAGGLYDYSEGEISPGNEKGIAFHRTERSVAGFSHVNFGPDGSDEITLPIFALDSNAYEIELLADDVLIAKLPYQKPSRWNVYQPETYHLPFRLKGVRRIAFAMEKKIHLKGFSFTKQSRAWQRLSALEADHVYGDSFERTDWGIENIGNNVSLVFERMNFEKARQAALTIEGRTPLTENPITILIQNENGEEVRELASFRQGRSEEHFLLTTPGGLCRVTFVFLPGCQFDFRAFAFQSI